jgi:mannosyltransferase
LRNISSFNSLLNYFPFLLIIIGFVLRLQNILTHSIGVDEPFSIYHAQLDIPDIIYQLSLGNNPPLFEIILHYWIKVFGISEFSVRFPSLLFSVLTIYVVYRIGLKFFSIPIAILSATLITFSSYLIEYSHEARVYSLFALLTCTSMYYFLKICHFQKIKLNFLILVLINSLLIYSHYFGFFVLFLQAFTILSFKELRLQLIKPFSLYLLALIVIYLPNIKIILYRFSKSSSGGNWVPKPEGFETIYKMLWEFSNKPVITVLIILILLLSLLKGFIKKDFKNINRQTKIILLWFIFPFLSMFLISYWIPMFLDRYLIFVSIGFYIVVAHCCFYLIKELKYGIILPLAIAFSFAFTVDLHGEKPRQAKSCIDKIKELKTENTQILFCPFHFTYNFAYYYDKAIFKQIDPINPYQKLHILLNKENIFPINNINELKSIKGNKIIYLDIAADFCFPDNSIIAFLNKQYKMIQKIEYEGNYKLYIFEK